MQKNKGASGIRMPGHKSEQFRSFGGLKNARQRFFLEGGARRDQKMRAGQDGLHMAVSDKNAGLKKIRLAVVRLIHRINQ